VKICPCNLNNNFAVSFTMGCEWKANIKIYLQEVKWGDMDWNDLIRGGDEWQLLVCAIRGQRVP